MNSNVLIRIGTALLPVLMVSSSFAQAPARRAPRRPAVKSPEVHDDGRVTFRLRGPKVQQVTLNASWHQGSKDLVKGADGMWTLTIGPLEPKIYNYTYSIDGVRNIDPHNPMLKTGIRSSSSVLDVPASPPAFWAMRDVPHGEVHIHHYASKATGTTRRAHVYTPPGYEANEKRYPVLYLLHGSGDDDSAWMSVGRAHLILDNLIARSAAEPMIVVMPFGHTVPAANAGRGVRNKRFENDLLGDVLPLVEARYRVKTDADSR
ncbi:MAG: esterase, partial [bacterium]|nr:esterase [bacterium]